MEWLDDLPLVDGHCHVVSSARLSRPEFEQLLTESDRPAPTGTTHAFGPLGLAVRRWCAPVLDLPVGAPLPDYLARRVELGPWEVCRRMLRAAGLSRLLVDTGISATAGSGEQFSLASLGNAGSAAVHEVVRLESVAEQLVSEGVRPGEFA